MTPAATSGFRAAQEHLLALAVYLLATVVFTWPLALNLTTAIPGDGFDGWQNYWNQWWIKQVLVDRLANPLYTDAIYHPTGVTPTSRRSIPSTASRRCRCRSPLD